MKYDSADTLIRQSNDWPAAFGDSCAETCRALILGSRHGDWTQFVVQGGFLRHPSLHGLPGWDRADFSGDQFIPLYLAAWPLDVSDRSKWKIEGTDTWLTIAAWFMVRGHWRSLNVLNHIQGWILKLPWRWSDSKKKFERAESSSADYLNFAIIYIFLKTRAKWATLSVPKDNVMAKIRAYYLEGTDPEPNSEWIVELYERALT